MTDMDYHDEDFLPSEEEMDEIWDLLIAQSELDTPFGRIAKAKLESFPPEPTTIFWVCLLQAIKKNSRFQETLLSITGALWIRTK